MQPPKSEICVICGCRPATTQDHVPPKCLFKGLSAQLITVPACAACNNGASSDDEDLRFYISMQVGKRTQGSAALWDQGAHKSIKRKRSLRQSVIDTARDVQTIDENGEPINRLAVNVPLRTYQTVFERTTRGLFFYHTGRILPQEVPVVVEPLDGVPELNAQEYSLLERHEIGGEACEYRYGIAGNKSNSSIWLYGFYRTHWVMVMTGEANE